MPKIIIPPSQVRVNAAGKTFKKAKPQEPIFKKGMAFPRISLLAKK